MTGRAGLAEELRRLAALIGVSGLAVAQPVLDAFGRSPETFVFRRAEGADLFLFALAVVLVPPVVVWGAGVLVGTVAPGWRLAVHGASIGGFIGLAAVQLLAGTGRFVALVAGALLTVGAWVLTVRQQWFRLWCELLAALPVVAVAAFLVVSPASEVVASATFTPVAASGPVAPVVLVILDELPTASIIDDDGAIDDVRFPNLARLAGQGTWYRNHTSLSGFTDSAVPTILTGREPEAIAPLYTQNPDNLFRLLAGSHDLVVSEAVTRLCPSSACGDTPIPPATRAAEGTANRGPEMGELLADAVDLWTDRVRGAPSQVRFDAFEEEVAPRVEPAAGGDDPTGSQRWEEAVQHQPERLTAFLDALEPANRPIAAVLHVISPHFPWHYLPDGRSYAGPVYGGGLVIDGGGDPWIAAVERQRHLLQASYADRLVGQILQRLEEVGMYDDAAIAVTADHGIAFREGIENRRLPELEALPELMWTPLIVKAPDQVEAMVDDANVQSIDVVPTLASLVGVDVPWPVDGVDAAGPGPRARGAEKPFHRFESLADPHPSTVVTVDGDEGLRTVLSLAFPAIAPTDDAVAGLYRSDELGAAVGQRYQPSGRLDRGTIVVDDLERLLGTREVVLMLTGTVDARSDDLVVVAEDGTIVAVSPVVPREGEPAFALLLPSDHHMDVGELRIGLMRGDEVLDAGSLES